MNGGDLIGMDDKDATWAERMERDPSLAAFVSSTSSRAASPAAVQQAPGA